MPFRGSSREGVTGALVDSLIRGGGSATTEQAERGGIRSRVGTCRGGNHEAQKLSVGFAPVWRDGRGRFRDPGITR